MLMDWPENCLIGIEELDEQHKTFFLTGQRLHNEIAEGKDWSVIKETFFFLKEYADKHFTDEEALMSEYGFSELDYHKTLHKEFYDRYKVLEDTFKESGPTEAMGRDVLELVEEWLINHILYEDMLYADELKGRM